MVSLRTAAAGRVFSWLSRLAVTMMAAAVLSACSGGSLSGVFSGGGNVGSSGMAPVWFANIIGPPKNVGDQLSAQLVSAAQQRNIPVVTDKSNPSAYTVQGYLAQSNERNSEKFSYILDVTDKSGKRVHRILGEEAVPAKPGAKPWSSINQAAMQKIAAKTANDLAIWLPKQSGTAAVAASPPPARAPARKTAEDKPPAPRRTASSTSRSENVAALIPPVSGAPGDGRTSLTKALRDRLQARGVQIASTGGRDVYKINGKVTMGAESGETQKVEIVWQLVSPTGRDLGTVTQQSNVPKGSLDRTWGPAAVAAGNAAAAEILKLIQKNRG